jgi:hypothetical protein
VITPSDVEKAVYVVDHFGAADLLEGARGKKKSGRPSGLTTRIYLIGLVLSCLDGDGSILTNVYEVLTRRMDFAWQVRLGIRPPLSRPSLDSRTLTVPT